MGWRTRIECRVAAPPWYTRSDSRPDISAVVAVALRTSFLVDLPNSFSTFSTNGPRLNLVLMVVWSWCMFTVTSPERFNDAKPKRVALALDFDFLFDVDEDDVAGALI